MVQIIILIVLAVIAILQTVRLFIVEQKLKAILDSIVTIQDTAPEKSTPKNRWLQLTNEGKRYVKTEGDKVYLTLIK